MLYKLTADGCVLKNGKNDIFETARNLSSGDCSWTEDFPGESLLYPCSSTYMSSSVSCLRGTGMKIATPTSCLGGVKIIFGSSERLSYTVNTPGKACFSCLYCKLQANNGRPPTKTHQKPTHKKIKIYKWLLLNRSSSITYYMLTSQRSCISHFYFFQLS